MGASWESRNILERERHQCFWSIPRLLEHPGAWGRVRGSEHPGGSQQPRGFTILKALELPGAFGTSREDPGSLPSTPGGLEHSRDRDHGAPRGFWSFWRALEHLGILRASHGFPEDAPRGCSDPEPCGKSWTPWSIPGPSEHPKLLGTPQVPGSTAPAHECPEEQPRPLGPSRILTATEAPERPLKPLGAPGALWSIWSSPGSA